MQGAEDMRVCEGCKMREAKHFCKCVNPPVFFCLSCSGTHIGKSTRAVHYAIPIAALNQNLEEYMRKYEALAQGVAALRKNIEYIEQFSREFDEVMQQCVLYLGEYRAWWLDHLNTEKEQLYTLIEAAVEETTSCLDHGVRPVNGLARALWNFPPEDLQVVNYSVTPPDLRELCQTWTTYQNQVIRLYERVESQVPRDYFAAVWEDKVELYDLHAQQSTYHSLPVNFGYGGSYIAINSGYLLCLGSYPPSTAVYELRLPSLQLTAQPPLSTSRAFAGVAKDTGFVYVFGGEDGSSARLKSCEKYELQDRQWLPLGSLQHGRSSFTPCTFRSLIYLPCPLTTPILETFDPATETFACLPVSIPPQRGHSSVAFVTNGELCVLNVGKQLERWRIELEDKFRLSAVDRECCSSQSPLL